ncbi:hypothetical protein NV379_16005 [Paenibacillus sp. N1-5-1-14]|uniref:hypothetical protein n=1 Tax=Paenibacillus radicibacter TaxID=2972488 RepID=UPI0021598DB1|nr:hypothetical protein [Paenibacillus radicibacter]MCR8644158.1 hypothetical protein [Paenibacillus radicibacter]
MAEFQSQVVSSFVLRFSQLGTEGIQERPWRIRVTHVQSQEEVTVGTLDDAMKYIDDALKKGTSLL